jgi:hypothetical protein
MGWHVARDAPLINAGRKYSPHLGAIMLGPRGRVRTTIAPIRDPGIRPECD